MRVSSSWEEESFVLYFKIVKIRKQKTIVKKGAISHDVFIHKTIIYDSKEELRTRKTSVQHFDHT